MMWKYILTVFISILVMALSRHDPRNNGDLALWIDQKQVKMFSGKLFMYN